MLVSEIDMVWLISRWIHLFSAIAAIGGAVFARVALLPATSEVLDDAGRSKLHEAVRRRWMRVVHVSVTLLLITGGFNFYWLALRPHIPAMPYHAIFLVKFLAALAVFFLATVLTGTSPGLAGLRANRAKWLSVIIGVGALIVMLSGVLAQVRGGSPVGG